MKKDLLLFAAFIFGVATTAGAAKNKAGERIDTLKARQLQEVQVISTRASKKAPLAFTNVSKNDIQAVNYGKDIPYLLALTPSITLTSDAGNGIGYTTLRVRGTDPSRVNITANGIPMNDAEQFTLLGQLQRFRFQHTEHTDSAWCGNLYQWRRCLRSYCQHADRQYWCQAIRWS